MKAAEGIGLRQTITVDNGPEFAGKVLDGWAYGHGIELDFIQPGKPVENVASFSDPRYLKDGQHFETVTAHSLIVDKIPFPKHGRDLRLLSAGRWRHPCVSVLACVGGSPSPIHVADVARDVYPHASLRPSTA